MKAEERIQELEARMAELSAPRRSRGWRSRWAAVGAAVAVAVGAGGLMTASATVSSGQRAVFVPITPCRVMDTRPSPETVGTRSTPIGANETYTIPVLGVNGNCTIPADAVGLSLNVTVIAPSASSFLTVFPPDATKPTASNLNWTANQAPVPNAVTTDISSDGKVSFYNLAGAVNVAADIVGYYVDHNHDDRYYTKAEADDRHLGFGNTLSSADTRDGATKFTNIVSFPNTGSPVMTISFGLPPGRDPARPIQVQIPFDGPPNCSFVLSATGVAGPFSGSTRFLNAGWSVVGSPSGIVALGPNPTGSGSSTTIVTLTHNSANQLGGGASVEMNLVRSAADGNDTCAGPVSARGGYSVAY